MGSTLDALKHIEVNAAPAAVILPLSRDPGERDGVGSEESVETDGRRKNGQIRPAVIQRFRFPALPESHERGPTLESPTVGWPECSDSETAWACAAAADGILRQLPLNRPTIVALTSAGDGDGKTSLLVGLAPQLVKRIAGSVLVVDANLRNPDLTARLRMPLGEKATRPALIYPTNLPRLNVLPTPRSLGVDGRWIEDLRDAWPLVLLDMPSLVHPEVASIARYCDGIYLVVRVGHTARRAVTQAARVIRGFGVRFLGCVVVE